MNHVVRNITFCLGKESVSFNNLFELKYLEKVKIYLIQKLTPVFQLINICVKKENIKTI